jgi:hypothetical protein
MDDATFTAVSFRLGPTRTHRIEFPEAVEVASTIRPLGEGEADSHRAFLQRRPEATIFYTGAWHRLIESTYGHRTRHWVAWQGRDLVGSFPVALVRHPLFGVKAVAMPYQFHSGLPIADSTSIQQALTLRAVGDATEAGAQFLELRHFEPVDWLEQLGFLKVDSHLVTSSCSLVNLDFGKIRRNHRRNIKAATEAGLSITDAPGLPELRMFRRMYLIEGRRLGAPQAGWRFFEHLHNLPELGCRLFLAWLNGNCIAGLLLIDDGRTVFSRCGAFSSPEALAVHAGRALYWRAMTDAASRGCTTFNLGITWDQDHGLIHDKEGWNAVTRVAHVYVYPIRSRPPSAGGYFEGFQLAKTVWRNLPLPIVDWAGAAVTRWVC